MYAYSRRQETLLRGHSFLDFCARLLSRCNRRRIYYLSLRLAPADEPPAEEADETTNDDDDCDGDPCYGACTEATLVRVSTSISAGAIIGLLLRYVTGDRAIATSWRSAAYAVRYTSYCIRASLVTIRAFEAFITSAFIISRKTFSAGT